LLYERIGAMIFVPRETIIDCYRAQTLSYYNFWISQMDTLWSYLSCLHHWIFDGAFGCYLQKWFQRSSQQKILKSNIRLCTNEKCTYMLGSIFIYRGLIMFSLVWTKSWALIISLVVESLIGLVWA